MPNESTYLATGLSQIQTNKLLLKELEPNIEELVYNTKRYNEAVCLVLFYTEEDISAIIQECIRKTDIPKIIHIGDAYFNFIFLPFSSETEGYTFIKHVEYKKLHNIEHYYYYEKIRETDFSNEFNFINTFLFSIKEQKEEHLA